MNTITNIKINYMLLEQILRVTGTYKNLCDEYKNLHGIFAEEDKDAEKDKDNNKKYFIREYDILDELFKRAKTGDINSLFENDTARDIVLEFIINFTGVPLKYWLGEERIKLGIRCKNEDLNYDGESIDTVDLDITVNTEKIYQEQLKNPLHLSYEDIYSKISGLEVTGGLNKEDEDKAIEAIESLYSLRGLLTVILLNMADEIELIDKANIYKRTKWEPYIRKIEEPTKHGITYSPKFVEIRKGLVQTIIRNIFDLGYVFTFRDLDKEFKI